MPMRLCVYASIRMFIFLCIFCSNSFGNLITPRCGWRQKFEVCLEFEVDQVQDLIAMGRLLGALVPLGGWVCVRYSATLTKVSSSP